MGAKIAPQGFQSGQGIETRKDSVNHWIKLSKNKRLSYLDRKYLLDKSFNTTISLDTDSIRNVYLSKIAKQYYRLGDSLAFRNANSLAIKLSFHLQDSIRLANNYWDLGDFYSKHEVKDSAYYNYSKAEKIYEPLDKTYYRGLILLNMAIIQSDLRDYTGSEVTTIRAIELLKPLQKDRQIYRCYNNLGVVFNELQEYDKALVYHNKALEYLKKIDK